MHATAWNISSEKWPINGTETDKFKFLLAYAVLAPSGHNTQPWLFKFSGSTLELYADRTRCLPVVDPCDRALLISCGSVLQILACAARRFSTQINISELPEDDNPDLLARITLAAGAPPSAEENALFEAIVKRHTNRQTFKQRCPHAKLLLQLSAAATEHATDLIVITGDKERQALAELIAQGDRIQAADKEFRRELSSWVHSNRSRRSDGIPGYALGMNDLASTVTPLILRTFNWGNGQAARDMRLAAESPVLAALCTSHDEPADWLAAGRALGAVLLTLTSHGLSASFLNQPIEVGSLRANVQQSLGTTQYPQLLLRIGFGTLARPTPRRPVGEVLRD